jgi:hypothetical protein
MEKGAGHIDKFETQCYIAVFFNKVKAKIEFWGKERAAALNDKINGWRKGKVPNCHHHVMWSINRHIKKVMRENPRFDKRDRTGKMLIKDVSTYIVDYLKIPYGWIDIKGFAFKDHTTGVRLDQCSFNVGKPMTRFPTSVIERFLR